MNDETAIKLRTGLGEHMQRVGMEDRQKRENEQRVRTWLFEALGSGFEHNFQQAMAGHGFLVKQHKWEHTGYWLEFLFSYLPARPHIVASPEEVKRDAGFELLWSEDSHQVVSVKHRGKRPAHFSTVEIVGADLSDFVTEQILKALEIEREVRRSPWAHDLAK
jgi:hypothetical protein